MPTSLRKLPKSQLTSLNEQIRVLTSVKENMQNELALERSSMHQQMQALRDEKRQQLNF
jgi:hypothetical protein